MSKKFSVASAMRVGMCRTLLDKRTIIGILLTAGYWLLGIQLFALVYSVIVGFINGIALGFFDARLLPTGSPGHTLLRTATFLLVSAVLLAPAAIASHRNYLLGEKWKLDLSVYGSKFGKEYIGFAVWVIIVVSGPVSFLNGRELWFPQEILSQHNAIFTIALFVTSAWAFIGTRFFLVLPGSAIGQAVELGDSWQLTSGIAIRVMLSLLLINLPFVFINRWLIGLKVETVFESFALDALIGLSSTVGIVLNAFLLSYIYRETACDPLSNLGLAVDAGEEQSSTL